MAPAKPPPLPPRAQRHVSQTVTLAQMLAGTRPSRESFPDEEPTRPDGLARPKGIEQLAALGRHYREMAPEDRAYLLRTAEGYAARNRKT